MKLIFVYRSCANAPKKDDTGTVYVDVYCHCNSVHWLYIVVRMCKFIHLKRQIISNYVFHLSHPVPCLILLYPAHRHRERRTVRHVLYRHPSVFMSVVSGRNKRLNIASMGNCVLNTDKEGKHKLEAMQLNFSSFVCKSSQIHADSEGKISFMCVNSHSFLAVVNIRTYVFVWLTELDGRIRQR
jgi:hypothetical protein